MKPKAKNRTLFIVSFLLLVLTVGMHFALRPFSPRAVKSELYSIKFLEPEGYVKRYQLQGDRLDCIRSDDGLVRICSTQFEGKSLIVRTENTPRMQMAPVKCELNYDAVSYPCEGGWDYENRSPSVLVRDDFGISAESFQELRRENPLLYLQESEWHIVLLIISSTAALLMGVIGFQTFHKESLAGWNNIPLQSAFFVALAVALGLSFGMSMVVNDDTARVIILPAASGAGLWWWHIVRRKPRKLYLHDRLIGATILTVFVLGVMNFMLLFNLLFLGFVD